MRFFVNGVLISSEEEEEQEEGGEKWNVSRGHSPIFVAPKENDFPQYVPTQADDVQAHSNRKPMPRAPLVFA
jgi:hypothetical protein